MFEVYSGTKPLAQGASYSKAKAEMEVCVCVQIGVCSAAQAYRAALRAHFSETYKSAPLPSEAELSAKETR